MRKRKGLKIYDENDNTQIQSVLGKRKPKSNDENGPSLKRQKVNCGKNYIYEDFEVVWAKLENRPWWPGFCDFLGDEYDKGSEETSQLPIQFYGTYFDIKRIDWVDRDKIIPFALHIEKELLEQCRVKYEDLPEYYASKEDAICRHRKLQRDKQREIRKEREEALYDEYIYDDVDEDIDHNFTTDENGFIV